MPGSRNLEQLRPWQQALIIGGFILCATVVSVLAAEGALRARHWIKAGAFWGVDQTYMIDRQSGLRIPIPNGHFGPVEINSFGFRSPEISVTKPPGRLRVAFLGSSTTFCSEVSSNQMTWPHLVWTTLQKHFPGADMDYINGSVSGYTTETDKKNLEQRVSRFHPDVIVIYEAANDLAANSYTLAVKQGVAVHTLDDQMGWLARHSLLVYLVKKNWLIWEQQHDAMPIAASRQISIDQTTLDSVFRDSLTALVAASKKEADFVVVATFASRLRYGQTPEELRAAAITSLFYMPYMTPEGILDGFRHYNSVIREVAANESVLLVGDEDSITADDEHYMDSAHFTDAGSAQMANRVVDAMLKSDRFVSLVTQRGYEAKGAAFSKKSN